MGTWGTGLFSDDIACDVRESYEGFVGDGHAGPEATDALLSEYGAQVEDPDAGPTFWLALAATQWRCGRLERRVKDRALEIIELGIDIRRWTGDPSSLKKRQAVLGKLAEQLRSPQPPPKRIPKRFRNSTDWQVGEIIAFRLKSGNNVLFRVIGFHTDRGGTSPVIELLDWSGESVPEKAVIGRFAVKARRHPLQPGHRNQFLIGRLSERDLPNDRVVRTGIKLKPSQGPGGFAVFLWRHLDGLLEATYDVS